MKELRFDSLGGVWRVAFAFAEELTLQELRQARKLTQVRVAKALALGINYPEFLAPLRRQISSSVMRRFWSFV